MRGWMTIVALALVAGCLDRTDTPMEAASAEGDAAVDEAAANATADATMAAPPTPVTFEGRVWLPPSESEERVESIVELPVAADGRTIQAKLYLGSWYGVAEVPPLLADVRVELRDPAGEVLAEASLAFGATDAEVEGTSSAGTATLVLLSYGGSDGQANGDHVDYVATIA